MIKFLVITLFVLGQAALVSAQGPLFPPGPPEPTMRTLHQIEPRIPISAAPFEIKSPGSYYLTANIFASSGFAISVEANDVAIDLNGFKIESTDPLASSPGILLSSGIQNVSIENGQIVGGVTNLFSGYGGPGFLAGISYQGVAPKNVRVRNVGVSKCYDGIILGTDLTMVESAIVRFINGSGISAGLVKDSIALECSKTAIEAIHAVNSSGESVSILGKGIYAVLVENCKGFSQLGNGIYADTVNNSHGISGASYSGIYCENAMNSYGYSPSYHGITAKSAMNCNGASGSSVGISARVVQNCYGESDSSIGISASSAVNSYGMSTAGEGINASTAAFCVGDRPGGIAVRATIGNGCIAAFGSTNLITHPYNMP